MNPKNTWLLVALAAGLFAFIYFFERQIQPPMPVVQKVLPGLKADEVTSIEIHPRGQFKIRVERTGAGWLMTQPLAYPVRTAAVEDLLKALVDLSPQAQISAQELQGDRKVSEEFGFDTPMTTILLQQGDDERRLMLGNPTPPGDGIYAQVVGSTGGIDIIGPALAAYIPTNAGQWRDTTFVNLQGLPFDELTVSGGNGQLKFHRDGPDQPWRMLLPNQGRADNGRINGLINMLQTLSVARFETDDTNADLEPYGLQTPQLELTFKQGTNQLLSLQFGKGPTNDPGLVYARTNLSSTIVLVPREDLKYWSEESWRFRDPYLFSMTVSDLPGSIECDGSDGHLDFILQGKNGAVIITDRQGQSYSADPGAVGAFVNNLRTMPVVPWAPGPGHFAYDAVAESLLPSMGLAPVPQRRYLVKEAGAAGATAPIIAQLDFGFPNTNQPGTTWARRSESQELSVYAVSDADLARLPTNGLQLRLRQVWNFEATNIARLKIEANGQIKQWKHERQNLWQPWPTGIAGDTEVKGMHLENLAANLGILEAESWVERGDPNAALGFTGNSLQLSLTLENENQPRTVTFGGPAPGGGYYACAQMEDGQNWIFVVSAKHVNELLDDLAAADPP
jgi:hypothetical protein